MPTPRVRSIVLETTLVPSIEGMCELVMVRHGEQALAGRLTAAESHDPPLSDLGERQVAAVAARLAAERVDAVYASPLTRALDTGRAIGRPHGFEPVVVDALSEFDPWARLDPDRPMGDQLPKEEIAGIFRQHSATRRWDAFRYSEDLDAFRTRSIGAMEEIMSRHEGERVVVACHSGVINTYLSHLWRSEMDLLVRVHHTSLTVVRGADTRRAVISVNDYAHVLPFQSAVNDSNL